MSSAQLEARRRQRQLMAKRIGGQVYLWLLLIVLYAPILLIFIFSFFYTFITVKPDDIANDLQKSNAFIPGVRPGEDTQNFIAKVLFKVTVIGATYLAILAAIPIITSIVFKLPNSVSIGGTSILIIVGVAIETAKQLETEASEKAFKGFM